MESEYIHINELLIKFQKKLQNVIETPSEAIGCNGYTLKLLPYENSCIFIPKFSTLYTKAKMPEYLLVIYPPIGANRDPHDYGRSRMVIEKSGNWDYGTYLSADAECLPICFKSNNLNELLPDDDNIKQYLNYEIRTFDKKKNKYMPYQ